MIFTSLDLTISTLADVFGVLQSRRKIFLFLNLWNGGNANYLDGRFMHPLLGRLWVARRTGCPQGRGTRIERLKLTVSYGNT